MSNRLAGKTVVLTGVGDGMGRTAALTFAAEGASVVGCDLNPETAAETTELVRRAGGAMECVAPLDLGDEAGVRALMERAVECFGGIDVVYANAMAMRPGTAEQLSLEDWDFTLRNTLTITWLTIKHAIPHLRARGGGSIVLVASGIGIPVGSGLPGNMPNLFPYAVTKAGVIRMTVSLAVELAADGIRVNAVSPGPVRTPATGATFGEEGSERRLMFERPALVGRLGVPDDIVGAALYLASDEAAWVTGHNLVVDGGWIAGGGLGRPDPEVAALFAPVVEDPA